MICWPYRYVLILAGDADKHEFQAETRKLLDIVAKSLYSEKEVEAISYGCAQRASRLLKFQFPCHITLM